MHVGGGVDRRAVYHEEQAALREALQRGTATIHGDRMLSPVVVTVSAASIDVHADAPNYRPPSTTVSKKECDERKHAKAMHEWQSGAHQLGGAAEVAGGALGAVRFEDESSDGTEQTLLDSVQDGSGADVQRLRKNKVGNCCWSISYSHYCCCSSNKALSVCRVFENTALLQTSCRRVVGCTSGT